MTMKVAKRALQTNIVKRLQVTMTQFNGLTLESTAKIKIVQVIS